MKRTVYIAFLAVTAAMALISCSKEELSDQSVIKEEVIINNEFDQWLYDNFLEPYNIRIKYRYSDTETDMDYYLTPADYRQSIALAHLIMAICIEPYDDVTNSTDFIRANYPKLLFFSGSPAYTSNGSILMGSAEGGMKITLYAVDNLDTDHITADMDYFKTLHHEFVHILHHKVPYPTDFNEISGEMYVGDSCWDIYPTDASAQKAGFISSYSATDSDEDFAELISYYVTRSESVWESYLENAGEEGAKIINSKFSIAKTYMMNKWGIDLEKLRNSVLSHTAKVPEMDLYSLD